MSTERNPDGPGGPGVTPNDFADAVAEGELFIRDLSPAGTGDDEGYDEDDDDGIVTTQMVGEEGDRGGGEKEKKDKDDGIVTTMAVGEEGDRGGGGFTS